MSVAGERIAVFNTSKGVKAVRNMCAHIGNPIDDGVVKGCILHCPWHGWAYDIVTGEHLTNFGRRPGIRTFGVRVEGDTVFVDVDTQPDSAAPG